MSCNIVSILKNTDFNNSLHAKIYGSDSLHVFLTPDHFCTKKYCFDILIV